MKTTRREIVCKQLTTCGVSADGKAIRLDLIARPGEPISIELPIEQAESVVMTLPRLLSAALRTCTGSADARYVFQVGEWLLERAGNGTGLILTLRTPDGFEVSFGLSHDVREAIGLALNDEGDTDDDAPGPATHRH